MSKTDRAFNKIKFHKSFIYHFYHSNNYNINYKILLKNECRDNFETIDSWRQSLKQFDNKIQSNCFTIKNLEFIQKINILISNYFYLVSKHMRDRQKIIFNNRIVSSNITLAIKRLQCLFIESATTMYYTIKNLSKSSEHFISKLNKMAFLNFNNEYLHNKKKQLTNTKYNISKKNTKIKKDLPKKIKNKIKKHLKKYKNNLNFKFFKNCNLKTYQKNHKYNIIKKIWISKPQSIKKHQLEIHTLKDRILQIILNTAAHPIVEYQNDPHSFSYHLNKTAKNIVALLIRHLKQLKKQKNIQKNQTLKISKNIYKKFKGWRYRQKILQIIPNTKQRQYKYLYQYYIRKPNIPLKYQTIVQKLEWFFYNYCLINIDIHKCFDNINHDIAIKIYPIYNKYQYLIKTLLKTPIYDPFSINLKTSIKQIIKNNFSQKYILNPTITNCILNGLEKLIENTFCKKKNKKYSKYHKKLNIIKKYSKNKSKKNKMSTHFIFLRFANNILILGKNTPETFETTLKVLIIQLKKKGLHLKKKNNPIIKFKPNISFDYLKFRFIYTNYKNKKLNNKRFTHDNYIKPFQTIDKTTSVKNRNRLLIIIKPQSFKNCYNKIQKILSRSNSIWSINKLMKHYNFTIQNIINYFNLTKTTNTQLKYLSYLSYHWIRKLLLQKFNSTPNIYSFVKSYYYANNLNIFKNKKKQLKITNIKIHNNIHLISTRLNETTLMTFIYIRIIK